jgi:putative protease
LVRNLGAIEYFKSIAPFQGELRGDFSLNATNHLTVDYLRSKGLRTICASYDLNSNQLQDLLNATNANDLEITVHQYMPSFHMEHCVFAANLSQGSSFKDCGKPCEKHTVELKDQFGNRHFIKADQECRNTMYNAVAQSASKLIPVLKEKSVRFLRFEALNEKTELIQKIESYLQVLDGQKNAEQIIAGLQSVEKYGLGEGNINSWR